MKQKTTQEIYDSAAGGWVRKAPSILSDFTGRPPVFALCGDVKGLKIIDLGCGEGYGARVLKGMGADVIDGIDISAKMVEGAKAQLGHDDTMRFAQGDVTALPFDDAQYDLAVGIFVYNYTHIEQMRASFREVLRVLKPGGAFVFSVPHPAFSFIKRELTAPFYFDVKGGGYFSSRDTRFFGAINRVEGAELPVEMIHKNFEDYMTGLKDAGFTSIPEIRELGVTEEHMQSNPDFFKPVADIPLHMAFRVRK